jgi:hypothetical protein
LIVDVTSLDGIPDFVQSSLGHKTFHALISGYLDRDRRGLQLHVQQENKAHPFAVQWERLLLDVRKSKEMNAVAFSEKSIFLLDWIVLFNEYKVREDGGYFLTKVKNKTQYYSAVFELYVYAAYWRTGQEMHPVTEEIGRRRPDYVVSLANKKLAYVECKSLEDLTIEEGKIWDQIHFRTVNIMRKLKKPWRLELHAKRHISGRDLEQILIGVKSFLLGDWKHILSILDGDMQISGEVLGEPDVFQFGEFKLPRRSETGLVEVEINRTPGGIAMYRNPMVVESRAHFEFDQTRRILNTIDESYSQFNDECPGFLHIEIPYGVGGRFLGVADNAYQRVFQYLENKPRINAVVLSSRYLNPQMKNDENPLVDYYFVVPNPKCRHEHPEGFAVLGSGMRHMPIDEREEAPPPFDSSEGTVVLEFGLNEPLLQQAGCTLLSYCSPDGHHQLRLWQSLEGFFRVDAVAPTYGRRLLRANLNHLEERKLHKLAVSWSEQGIVAALNGNELSPLSDA